MGAFAQLDLDGRPTSFGRAEMIDRGKEFTASEVLKTDAMSGSRTTATVLPLMLAAKRFDLALL